jgi:hypothetical protein
MVVPLREGDDDVFPRKTLVDAVADVTLDRAAVSSIVVSPASNISAA